jgi:hypothetical protein
MYDLQTINNLADDAFTNLEGDEDYIGYGDDFLNFGGEKSKASSFANEIKSNNAFTVSIVNLTGIAQNLILFPSYRTRLNPAGLVIAKDGIITGVVGADLTGSGSPSPINDFLEFVYLNPTNIAGFKVSSNVPDQLAVKMTIQSVSPYRKLGDNDINLADYSSETYNNDKLLTIPESFQVDNQTDVSITIPVGARTVFTFYIGATLNNAHALTSKAKRASRHPMVQASKAMMGARK